MLKLSLFSFLLVVCPTAFAMSENGKLKLDSQTMEIICDNKTLNLSSPEISWISLRKVTQVSSQFQDQEECLHNLQMLTAFFRAQQNFEVDYSSRLDLARTYLHSSERCGTSSCSIDVQENEVFQFDFRLLGYFFRGSDQRFLRETTESWPRELCPPWAPDCDL